MLFIRSSSAFLLLALCINPASSFSNVKGQVLRHQSPLCLNDSTTSLRAAPKAQYKKKYSAKKYGKSQKKNWSHPKAATHSPPANRQLNQKIVAKQNAKGVLDLMASTKGALTMVGGGGKMNSVNFSTAFHRIARHVQFYYQNKDEGNDRSTVLSDPRFALLACSCAEALAGIDDVRDAANKKVKFMSRDCSSLVWAIAKLRMAPPNTAQPVMVSDETDKLLKAKSEEVRSLIYEVAKQRNDPNSNSKSGGNSIWIPALSGLCGLMMDSVACKVTKSDPNNFQLQEYSNFLWALATSKRADDQVFSLVISNLVEAMSARISKGDTDGLRPQEWSNSIWALATSGVSGPEDKILPFVSKMMVEYPYFLKEFKPQELSNTIWGVATIMSKTNGEPEGPAAEAALTICRCVAREVIKREGRDFKSQELSNTVWAFATMGFGLNSRGVSENVFSDYTILRSDDEEGDQELMKEAVTTVITVGKQGLQRYHSQELNNIAWTLARLKMGDSELFEMIAQQLADRRRKVGSQDIATTLWAFATSEFFSKEFYSRIVSRMTPNQVKFWKPQELSNTIWALSTADILPKYPLMFDTSLLSAKDRPSFSEARDDPVTMAFVYASQELMERPHQFKPQEIKDILWAMSRAKVRNPKLFKSVAIHLVGEEDSSEVTGRGLQDFSAQGLGNLAWAYARQAQLGAETLANFGGRTTVPKCSGRLAHYVSISNDLGEVLVRKLFNEIAETDLHVHNRLGKLKPQDICNTAWAFAILGLKHSEFLAAVVEQIRTRTQRYKTRRGDPMLQFKGQEMANGLWALATLNYNVPESQELLYDIVPYLNCISKSRNGKVSIKNISSIFNRQELANVCWVCAVFDVFPEDLIRYLYQGLLGVEEKTDPKYVESFYRDGGLMTSSTMSILYTQIAMNLKNSGSSSNDILLPANFPDDWDTGSSSSSTSATENDNMFDNFELHLTRSNTQIAISESFQRIGFDHQEEHVITLDNLIQDHGVHVTSAAAASSSSSSSNNNAAREILSLDIANLDSRVGIEVDGPGHFITNLDKGILVDENGNRQRQTKRNDKEEYQFCWDYDHQEVNGPTALKIRMLEDLGWRVLNIPFWDWSDISGDSQKEEDYCRSVIE